MQSQQSHIESLLQSIEQCNRELQYLSIHPEEANRLVKPHSRFGMDSFFITNKNRVELEKEELIKWLNNHLEVYDLKIQSSQRAIDVNGKGPKYLAFLDILGFSNLIRKKDYDELEHFIESLITDIQRGLASDEDGTAKTRLYNNGYFGPDLTETTINSILLSDTIIFWTKDDSAQSFYELLKLVHVFMYQQAYLLNVALRGAITLEQLSYEDIRVHHSELVIDQSTIFGKAIVDAAELEKKQTWMGCIVTQKAVTHFLGQRPPQPIKDTVFGRFLIKYPVPMKLIGSSIQEEYVIKWPRTWKVEGDWKTLKKCFTKHQGYKAFKASTDVQDKYKNTVKFAKYVLRTSL